MQPGCHGNVGVNLISADSVEMDNFASMNKHSPVFLNAVSLPLPRFVLWHVDELMSREQGKIIIDNAHNRCPAGAEKLCQRLELKAKNPF